MTRCECADRFFLKLVEFGADMIDALDAAECHEPVGRPGEGWNPEADAENWVERRWQAEMERSNG